MKHCTLVLLPGLDGTGERFGAPRGRRGACPSADERRTRAQLRATALPLLYLQALRREIQDLRNDGYTTDSMREFLRDMIANLNGMYHVMTVNPRLRAVERP